MGKEKKEPEKPQPPTVQKEGFYPKLMLLIGIAFSTVAITSYLNIYVITKLAFEIMLLFSGIYIFRIAIGKGLSKRRMHILKKYM
jgi:hypothetical protein